MAVNANATYLANLVNPEVIGDLVNKKLTKLIKFAPLADIDTTLLGRPGDTLKFPSWNYIGKASVTAEGQPITINQLTAGTTPVTVKKVGNGIELTDEAVLSGYGDPIGEGADQLALSIADAIDDEFVTALAGNTANTVTKQGTDLDADDINEALVKFGEDIDGVKVLLINSADYKIFRKSSAWLPASEIAAAIVVKGAVGEIYGCQVVVSDRVTAKTAHIVKPGALALILKRDTLVESDRDIINKSTVMTADKHFAAYLKDASKAVYIK